MSLFAPKNEAWGWKRLSNLKEIINNLKPQK
jgi:hypothetical protein